MHAEAALSARLRAMRKAAGLTQADLASALSTTVQRRVALQTVSDWERGRSNIALSDAIAWAEVCGYDLRIAVAPLGSAEASDPIARALDNLSGARLALAERAVLRCADESVSLADLETADRAAAAIAERPAARVQ